MRVSSAPAAVPAPEPGPLEHELAPQPGARTGLLVPSELAGMRLRTRVVTNEYSEEQRRNRRHRLHHYYQVQQMRAARVRAEQAGMPSPVYTYSFYDTEWMNGYVPRGYMLRIHRRFFSVVDAMCSDEAYTVPGVNDEIKRIVKDLLTKLRGEASAERPMTLMRFVCLLTEAETEFRMWFMNNIQEPRETDYDHMVTELTRRIRLHILQYMKKKNVGFVLGLPRQVALPMTLRLSGPGALSTDLLRMRFQRPFLGYWKGREELVKLLEAEGPNVEGWDDGTGWNTDPIEEISHLASELVEVLRGLYEPLEAVWAATEMGDEFVEDLQVDAGGLSDGEDPPV